MRSGDNRIGKLRDRITIQKPVRSEHPHTGEITLAWLDEWINVPAVIETHQTETEKASRLARVTQYTVTVRYLAGLESATDRRAIIDGETCEIVSSVDPDRRKRWLVMTAVGTS